MLRNKILQLLSVEDEEQQKYIAKITDIDEIDDCILSLKKNMSNVKGTIDLTINLTQRSYETAVH